MKKQNEPDWNTLLNKHFGLSEINLFSGLQIIKEWAGSWLKNDVVANEPLHRKKTSYGTDK